MKLEVNNDELDRLDVFLTKKTEYSRSKIQKLIKDSLVLVNGEVETANYKLKVDDIVEVLEFEDENLDIVPEKMDLDIVYEDEYLLIINKPSGMVVHPAVGNYSHTLVNGLLYYFNTLSNKNSIRPGIVHRLDKDTSGLMMVAKNDLVHEKLADIIQKRQVEKKYIALVWGVVRHDKGTINAPIGRDANNRQKFAVTDINGKDSITHFKVLERYKEATLIECTLETGRTHQIRVHLNYIGHPIVNDQVYGNRKIINDDFGQMLHSKSLRFIHPITNKELYFEIEPPKEFEKIVEEFI